MVRPGQASATIPAAMPMAPSRSITPQERCSRPARTASRRPAAGAHAAPGLAQHVGTPGVPEGAKPAWHLYVVTSPRADDLIQSLAGHSIQARGYYRTPLHRQPAMAPWGAGLDLPVTEELARTNLAIPMSPVLTAYDAAEVVGAIAEFET